MEAAYSLEALVDFLVEALGAGLLRVVVDFLLEVVFLLACFLALGDLEPAAAAFLVFLAGAGEAERDLEDETLWAGERDRERELLLLPDSPS